MNTNESRPAGQARAAGETHHGAAAGFDSYSTPKSRRAPIRVGARVVGYVERGIFFKRLRAAHFLRTPPAVAFDESSLADAERAGARWVQIHDVDSGRTLRAALATIRARGISLDRGSGRQIALPLALWATDDEPAARQLRLL